MKLSTTRTLALAVVAAMARSAVAAPPDARLTRLGREAKKAAVQCKAKPGPEVCAAAVALLQAAAAASPQWSHLHNLAIVQLHAGDVEGAWETAKRAVLRAEEQGDGAQVADFLQRIEARILATRARVDLTAVQAGVQVEVDGRRVTPPATLWPAPGRVTLVAHGEALVPQTRELQVVAGARVRVDLELARELVQGSLRVEGTPAGGLVSLDGVSLGRLPSVAASGLKPGPATLMVSAAGYEAESVRLVVLAGQTLRVPVALVPNVPSAPNDAPPVPTWATWTVLGAGLAMATGGIVSGGLAAADRTPTVMCPGGGSCAALEAAGDRFTLERDLAIGLGTAGLVAIVAGVVMSFLDEPPAPPDRGMSTSKRSLP